MVYRVRKEWNKPETQIGAYRVLANAINDCNAHPDYYAFDENGVWVYKYKERTTDKCPYQPPTRVLKQGCYGSDVKWLQWQLVALGFNCGASGVDGDFGNNTEYAVKIYQEANELEIDGVCGPATRASIVKNGFPSVDPQPASFTPRFKIPDQGNKYYNTPSAGGYAVGAILGKPTQPDLNVLANCVGYASGRFNEIIGQNKWVYLTYPPNAEDFITKAKAEGLTIDQTPSLGAIIVWAKGQTGTSSDGAGHVAVVEQINKDGSIITSESGYNCSNPFWTTTRYNGNGNWGNYSPYRFLGFIRNPAVK